MEEEVPKGLHQLQYARKLCEETMSWPFKGNGELIADCVYSLSKSKKLSLDQAYKYLVRAVRLYREQGGEPDYMWFKQAEYLKVRPKFDRMPLYKPMTAEEKRRLAEDQASPEWQELYRKMDAMLKSWSQSSKMEGAK